MIFTTYGNKDNPPVLLMHGMCQDWHSMYLFLHDLEARYYLHGSELCRMIVNAWSDS